MARVIVATIRAWNIRRYRAWAAESGHTTRLIQRREGLTLAAVSAFGPDYVLFPHWSWRIPAAIYERYECVAFHMTDLPFGRGGSPLQHLIVRGMSSTQMSALRVGAGMDAGPVYLKRPLSLSGTALEIYTRAADLIYGMIDEIIGRRMAPRAQAGRVVRFKRRTPEQSLLPASRRLRELYDFIRMLDAPGYPAAFLVRGGCRYEFSRAALRDGRLEARVAIRSLGRAEEARA